MKVKYLGKDLVAVEKDKTYVVMSIENGWYRIMTEIDEDYLFPPDVFEITDNSGYEELKKRDEAREWVKPKSDEKTA